ncbi:hypothetical protein J6590_102875 [Homalodisca vitripennis]|nr:hypothetical protein J6590_102875 [Homalodisca vitripennis]
MCYVSLLDIQYQTDTSPPLTKPISGQYCGTGAEKSVACVANDTLDKNEDRFILVVSTVVQRLRNLSLVLRTTHSTKMRIGLYSYQTDTSPPLTKPISGQYCGTGAEKLSLVLRTTHSTKMRIGLYSDQTDTRPPLTKPISGQYCGTEAEKLSLVLRTTHSTKMRIGLYSDQTDTRPPLTKPISGQYCGTEAEKSVACVTNDTLDKNEDRFILGDQTDTRPPLTKPISGQYCGTGAEKSVACVTNDTLDKNEDRFILVVSTVVQGLRNLSLVLRTTHSTKMRDQTDTSPPLTKPISGQYCGTGAEKSVAFVANDTLDKNEDRFILVVSTVVQGLRNLSLVLRTTHSTKMRIGLYSVCNVYVSLLDIQDQTYTSPPLTKPISGQYCGTGAEKSVALLRTTHSTKMRLGLYSILCDRASTRSVLTQRSSLHSICANPAFKSPFVSILLTMPRRKRPNIGRRSRSNVRRDTSRANRTDDQQETDNYNSRIIGMAHLRSTVTQNEVARQRMQRVRANRSQQQRAREKEIDRFRKRNAPVNLERAAFSYDPEIDYSAEYSTSK